MSAVTLTDILRYPVKGLSAERLEAVEVAAGETLPFDRAYAIENGPGRFDPAAPRHLPKITYLMLMRDERLATLASRFDAATSVLTIERGGRQVARGDLATPIGRLMIEQFLAAYMKGSLRGAPRIVSAPGHSFTDIPVKALHLINLASVRELERHAGRPLDPLRFRANLHVDGLPAFAELKLLDKTLSIGPVRLDVLDRTTRCEATAVEPASGARDLSVTALLRRHLGHEDFGIYLKVATGGRLERGAAIEVT